MFTRGPKPTRAERQVRSLSRGLYLVSRTLLLCCMAMTAIFGWSLGFGIVSQVVFAVTLAAADYAGALMWESAGVGAGLNDTRLAKRSQVFGVICFGLTLAGIIGFQASNRETVAQGRQQAVQASKDVIEWSKNVVVDKATGKERKDILLDGISRVSGVVNDQIKRIASGELVSVSDAQAYTFAKLANIEEATARSILNTAVSAAILIVQYGAIWVYGFIRHNVEPDLSPPNSVAFGADKTQKNRRFSRLQPKMGKAEAKADFMRLVDGGFEIPSQRWLAKRWGCSEATVVAWLNDWGIDRKRQAVGLGNKILPFPAHANGHAKQ